ncbi:divergent protein kinase domain 1A-like [Asterias amurensis]|uniref:divergent protein kinase domain 1A-like n=1 Tax=Asterias amurensis TaxID=7602 RepID=UPI003AB86E2B
MAGHYRSIWNFNVRMGRHRVKLKVVVLIWLLLFFGAWVIYLSYAGPDVCKGELAKDYICDNYSKGIIAGSLCPELCQLQKITLDGCLSKDASYQVYEGTLKKPPKRKRNMDEELYIKQDLNPRDIRFSKPASGTSMEDFRIMLSAYLKTHLGEGKYDIIQSRILDIADVNNDGKVSLPEARSMWALLQEKEFLMMMVLGNSDYIPKLLGFCGNMYIMEGVYSYRLFGTEFPSIIDYLLPGMVSRYFKRKMAPPWSDKAHIVVGLLEFVEEILDGPMGNLYMCNVNELGIGYTGHSDVKVLKVEGILTEQAVQTSLQERACTVSADCALGENCRSFCDSSTGRCSGEIIQPNLQRVCHMLRDYLLDNSPYEIRAQLRVLLDKCEGLEKTSTNMQMDHSLVLNNLKSLLWKQVSHLKKFSKAAKGS